MPISYSVLRLFTVPNTIDFVYGVRGGRRLSSRFALGGGLRFNETDRKSFAIFVEEDGSIPQPFPSSLHPMKRGKLLVSDFGFKLNIGQKASALFLYAGNGTVRRTEADNQQAWLLLTILARQQNLRVAPAGSPARPFTYHLDFGGGAEISMGRRWGSRFELRDRIEPSTFRDKARHFPEITAGPSFRF